MFDGIAIPQQTWTPHAPAEAHDIPLLIAFFVQQMAQRDGIAPRRFSPDAVRALTELDWSGNVRELRNTVERLLILSAGDGIALADVHRLVGRPSADTAGLGALMQCKSFEDFKLAAEEAFLRVKLREGGGIISSSGQWFRPRGGVRW